MLLLLRGLNIDDALDDRLDELGGESCSSLSLMLEFVLFTGLSCLLLCTFFLAEFAELFDL